MSEARTFALLSCRCGAVKGRLASPSPHSVNRVTCYCGDCQAFAWRLKRPELLDGRGGSDIVQAAPADLIFDEGKENIVGLRLSPEGLFRFHSRCCNTPLGNTVGTKIPFVGVFASVFSCEGQEPERLFGKPRGAIMGQYAVGGAPPGTEGLRIGLAAQAILKVLGWLIRGRAWPHPFFDRETRGPHYPVTILSREERDALRPYCGPSPRVSS